MIDTTQPAAPAATAPQQGTICIAPLGDGTFMVYPEGTEPTGQPVDLEGALELVRQQLGSAGQAGQAGQAGPSSAEAEAEALFTGEFDKTNPRARG